MSSDTNYISPTAIAGLIIIDRPLYGDPRGSFKEPVRIAHINEYLHINFSVAQWSNSKSNPGVLRGLHAERWDKLIYVSCGLAFLAFVDIREDSPTFGKYVSVDVTDSYRPTIFVPEGLANSFCVLGTSVADYHYLISKEYDPTDQRAFLWNDPDIGIPWPITNPILSDKDKANPPLRAIFPERFT
jgi:dTDP-4-dehydrorhamnose 3,5-epimerase